MMKLFTNREALQQYDIESESWTKALNRSYKTHIELSTVLNNIEDVDEKIYKRFLMKVTPYIAQLMDENDPNCPIRLQYIPNNKELIIKDYEMIDSLSEDNYIPEGTSIVHRYPNRVLFLVNNICGSYCRYCTRKRMVSNTDRSIKRDELKQSIQYIASNKQIEDVLLSGGDPLLLSDNKLDSILSEIRTRATHVKFIRISSRLPVQLPTRITPELCEILERNDVQMLNIHVNHSMEITSLFKQRIRMLRKTGIMLGCQSVLLKGVNDKSNILRELCMNLINNGIRPYYIYSCDIAQGNDQFVVSYNKMVKLAYSLRGHISGPAQPTFVIDGPGGLGKIPVQYDYIKKIDDNLIATNYEGKEVILGHLQ